MNKQYTEKDWEDEMKSNFFCGKHLPLGSCSLLCPQCKTLGFYGPRGSSSSGRKYRACKFCGFWQEAWGNFFNEHGGGPYRCIAVYCDKCGYFDWQDPWAEGGFKHCPKCGAEMKKIDWASDDPKHHFHKIKEQMDKAHQGLDL